MAESLRPQSNRSECPGEPLGITQALWAVLALLTLAALALVAYDAAILLALTELAVALLRILSFC